MADTRFYDGTKLLSLKDLDGLQPEIYICTTNRSAGKTTYFGRMFVNRFLNHDEKFALLYRFKYELNNIGDKFFKDIGALFFPGWTMQGESRVNGIYHDLYLIRVNADGTSGEKLHCGYALTLNSADNVKKLSHLFSDVQRILFDEFQPETNTYCPNEIIKFQSIHTSLARGQGKQSRYLPVYMLGNNVTLLNPYYVEFGIAARLDASTKFMRGHGWVLEQGFNESAAKAQQESGFNRAFSSSAYSSSAFQGSYLYDNQAFVERLSGNSKYLCTLRYMGKDYGVREFVDQGLLYCDDRPDSTFKYRISVTTEDHNINFVMLRSNSVFLQTLKYYFDHGCFRFKNIMCKDAIIKALAY